MSPLSNLTPFSEITAGSQATPGLWNERFSTISDNIGQLNSDLTTFSNLSNQFFNIRNYGAVGDGSTDDLSALSAAVSAASAVSGTVLLPAGTYAVGSAFTFPQNVALLPLSGALLKPSTSSATVTVLGAVPVAGYRWADETNGKVVYRGPGRSDPTWYRQSAVTLEDWLNLSKPKPFAHRGASFVAHENTFPAFAAAIGYGAELIETDTVNTVDGVEVVNHDDDAGAPLWDSSGQITDKRIDEILQIRSLLTGFTDISMPLTNEILNNPGNNLWQIEVKSPNINRIRRLAQDIIDRGLENRIRVSFNHNTTPSVFTTIKEEFPNLLFTAAGISSSTTPDVTEWASRGVKGIGVFIESTWLNEDFVADAHAAGIGVTVFTTSSRSQFDRMAALGVDLVQTDNIGWVLGNIEQPGLPFFDDFNRSVLGPYYIVAGASRPNWSIGSAGLSVSTTAADTHMALVGATLPSDESVRIEFTYTPTTLNGDDTRWIGIQLLGNDEPTHAGTPVPDFFAGGYNIFIRQNGQMRISKLSPGSNTNPLSTITASRLTVGTETPLMAEIGPNGIVWARTDSNETVTSSDTEFRGGYVAFIVDHTAGSFSSFSVTTV